MHVPFEGIMSDTSTFLVAPCAANRDKGPAPLAGFGAPATEPAQTKPLDAEQLERLKGLGYVE